MTTRIGLIGGGNISETHARAALAIPGVEIAAVFGTNEQKVQRICQEYGGKPFLDFDAFLDHRPMELVIIGSPSGLHAAQGIAAAQHGLHVLTEKPIDISTERADTLIAAAEKAGVKLGVLFQDRTKPEIRRLKRLIDDGALGKPILADARVKWFRPTEYYAESQWRGSLALDGGGALINQGVHTIDLLLWLLGDVRRVQAAAVTALHDIEAEDTVAAVLEFANGALGVFTASTAAYPGYPRRLELTGTRGTIILERDGIVATALRAENSSTAAVSGAPGGASVSANQSGDVNRSATSAVVSDFSGHQAVIEDFLRAIQQGGTPACDGREGRRSIALVEAIYRAARNSGAVDSGAP